MRVKPRQVAVGVVAVVCLGVVPALLLLRWGEEDLVVELPAEPPLRATPAGSITGVVRGGKSVMFSLDDNPHPVPGGKFEVSTAGLAPGLHVARFRTSSGPSTQQGLRLWQRSVALGLAQGPFEDSSAWQNCAARLLVGQAFLDNFADQFASKRLSEALAGQPNAPPVVGTAVTLTWAGDGIDGKAHVDFSNGHDLDLRIHVRIWVDEEHELHLERTGRVDPTGSQVAAWEAPGRVVGAVVGALGFFFGPAGGVVGMGLGAQAGTALAAGQVQQQIRAAVDEQGAALEEILRLPPSFKVQTGIAVHMRYCRGVDVKPGREASVGFDVQTALAVEAPVATPGPVGRPSEEPPLPVGSTALPALMLDVSPNLLDGFLDAWWRSGRLTRLMNEKRWLETVNGAADGGLDIQIEHVEPLLPPSLEMVEGRAVLRTAETKLTLLSKSQGKERDTRLFADIQVAPRYAADKQAFLLDWRLAELSATCHDVEPATGHVLLRPCYADLLQMVNEQALALPNPNVALTLSLPLRHILFKGGGTRHLPFALSHVSPTVLDSSGTPWVRITADVSP